MHYFINSRGGSSWCLAHTPKNEDWEYAIDPPPVFTDGDALHIVKLGTGTEPSADAVLDLIGSFAGEARGKMVWHSNNLNSKCPGCGACYFEVVDLASSTDSLIEEIEAGWD